MVGLTKLKGITWSNPRGYFPLIATAQHYAKLNPEVEITWEVRSLKEFGDYPIEKLINHYDLIIMDHPHVGISSMNKLLTPLNDWISSDYLKDQAQNSVGRSYESYQWNNQQYALPVDAAAQVAAYREDLLHSVGQEIPKTWEEVFQCANQLPESIKIGIPLVPTDCICSFISLCGNMGGDDYWTYEQGIEKSVGEEALYILQRLSSVVHPDSFRMNPIQMLNRMVDSNNIVYVPLTFGYSHYSRLGFVSNILHFTNIPSFHDQCSGSILGGVGLAISPRCKNMKLAVDYVMFTCSKEIQTSLYFTSGGQPGYLAAWRDANVNLQSNHFFANTLETLKKSSVRPRHPGYNEFQEEAGDLIYDFLKRGRDYRVVYSELNTLYLSRRQRWG